MDAVAIAIKLEASYQIWRAQHERYLLLSRRLWLNGAPLKEVREVGPQSGHGELYRGRDYAADCPAKLKMRFVVADDVARMRSRPSCVPPGRYASAAAKSLFLPIADAIRTKIGAHGTNRL